MALERAKQKEKDKNKENKRTRDKLRNTEQTGKQTYIIMPKEKNKVKCIDTTTAIYRKECFD